MNSSDIILENTSQPFENEIITEVITNTLLKKTPSRVEKAFSWNSYSHNTKIPNNDESQYQKFIPHISQNDSNSMNDGTAKVKILIVL